MRSLLSGVVAAFVLAPSSAATASGTPATARPRPRLLSGTLSIFGTGGDIDRDDIAVDLGDGGDRADLTPSAAQGPDVELVGGGGADTLVAAAGDDILDGGPGTDLLSGAAGQDVLLGGEILLDS